MEDGGFWLILDRAVSESEGLVEEEFRRPRVAFAGGKNPSILLNYLFLTFLLLWL